MGIGFVLVFWLIVGTIVAAIGALGFGSAAAYFTHQVSAGRRLAITVAAVLPFACLGWAGVVFAIQAVVNESVFHRDPGIGDYWRCPLPNGYEILMIDVTDFGSVRKPNAAHPDKQQHRVELDGVRKLQIAGRYILAASSSDAIDSRESTQNIDSYVLVDTKLDTTTPFPSEQALTTAAKALGIQPHLEPIVDVYDRYRFSWFDRVAALLYVLPPSIGAALLIYWIVRLRRTRALNPQTS